MLIIPDLVTDDRNFVSAWSSWGRRYHAKMNLNGDGKFELLSIDFNTSLINDPRGSFMNFPIGYDGTNYYTALNRKQQLLSGFYDYPTHLKIAKIPTGSLILPDVNPIVMNNFVSAKVFFVDSKVYVLDYERQKFKIYHTTNGTYVGDFVPTFDVGRTYSFDEPPPEFATASVDGKKLYYIITGNGVRAYSERNMMGLVSCNVNSASDCEFTFLTGIRGGNGFPMILKGLYQYRLGEIVLIFQSSMYCYGCEKIRLVTYKI